MSETNKHALRDKFLKWQCLTRQSMMREGEGRPDGSTIADVCLTDDDTMAGQIITILNKLPDYSVTPEMQHMARKTNDPALRREEALKFFSATYYQKYNQFSDWLTATFAAESEMADRLLKAEQCRLKFDACSQKFDILCDVLNLPEEAPLHITTLAHNRLFNPSLPGNTIVLGFKPDWSGSTSSP